MFSMWKSRAFAAKRLLSTLAEPRQRLETFRTNENDPTRHTEDHIGQYYKISEEDRNVVFLHGGLPKTYSIQTKTFNETTLMVRKPAVDVINYLKRIDYSKPAVRFVLYGDNGCGKSLSMVHVLHYAYRSGFLLVHIPWVNTWMVKSRETSNSEVKEGFIDLNMDAVLWLAHFKNQNSHLLNNPELKLSDDCIWNHREKLLKDALLLELIDFGINRVKYASRCVDILCNEIKRASIAGKCKTLVAIDGFNFFFNSRTKIFTEKKEQVHPSKVTLTEPFMNLTKFDWNNGAVVVTVDKISLPGEHKLTYFPRHLLGKEGFEHLDPFVPIPVAKYTSKEFKSCMDYFRERKWVQELDGQDEEMSFLSTRNPYKLMMLCNSL